MSATTERQARQDLQIARAAYARDETSHHALTALEQAEKNFIRAIPAPVCTCHVRVSQAQGYTQPRCPVHPGRPR